MSFWPRNNIIFRSLALDRDIKKQVGNMFELESSFYSKIESGPLKRLSHYRYSSLTKSSGLYSSDCQLIFIDRCFFVGWAITVFSVLGWYEHRLWPNPFYDEMKRRFEHFIRKDHPTVPSFFSDRSLVFFDSHGKQLSLLPQSLSHSLLINDDDNRSPSELKELLSLFFF